MPDEGYAMLALGDRRYYEMALTAALSARIADPSRPIALICDRDPDVLVARWFDEVVPMAPMNGVVGVANKTRLAEHAPFARTMVIDADCIVVRRDMDRHWARFAGRPVGLAGERRTTGEWYGFAIPAVLEALGLPYLVEGNSGVLTFDRPAGSEAVGRTAVDLLLNHAHVFALHTHQGRQGQLSDEPFWGCALGRHEVPPVAYHPAEGTIMATSLRARRQRADLARGETLVEKPTGFRVAGRLWAKDWVPHRPSVMHFIGLKPRSLYSRLSEEVRSASGVAPDPFLRAA